MGGTETDNEPILSGPCDGWPRLELPLASRLVRSLVAMGDRIVQVFPDSTAGTAQESSARWLLERAAAEDASLRMTPGAVVAVCCSCGPGAAPVLLAALARGALYAPINPDLPAGDLQRLLSRLSPVVVLCEEPQLAAVSAASPVPVKVLGSAPSLAPVEVQRFVSEQVVRPPPTEEEMHQPAIALHSSGTTGDPKTILLSQNSIAVLLDIMRRKDSNFNEGDVLVVNTPFFWVTAATSLFLSLDYPVTMVAVKGMNPSVLRDAVQKYKATAVLSATHVWTSMVKLPDASPGPFRSVRYAVSCGSSLDASKTTLVESTLGVRMSQWYGTTEVLVVTGLTRGSTRPPLGSVGRLSAYTQAKVVDVTTGRTLGAGQDGELCFRGPMSCNAVGPDKWYHTGDIGHYDSNGWIFVVDRVKELIKFQGIHVSPSEIESVLVSHPAVADAVVLGQPHLTDTEHPTAFVVLRPGAAATPQELVDLVADKLSNYPWKQLRGGVHFIPSIPRTVVGKVRRGELLQALTAVADHVTQ